MNLEDIEIIYENTTDYDDKKHGDHVDDNASVLGDSNTSAGTICLIKPYKKQQKVRRDKRSQNGKTVFP